MSFRLAYNPKNIMPTKKERYETLKQIIEDNNCLLITSLNDFTNDKGQIEWQCQCNIGTSKTNKTSARTFKQHKGCSTCPNYIPAYVPKPKEEKTEKRKVNIEYYRISYENAQKFFNDNDCILKTTKDQYRGGNSPIIWECNNCKEDITSKKLSSLMLYKSFSCRKCREKYILDDEGRYDLFCKELQNEGWTMVSLKKEYKNTMTLMKVKTHLNVEMKTSYNRFVTNGHRDKLSANNKKRNNIKNVEEELKKRNLTLVPGQKYKDNKTDIEYICHCGLNSKITFTNLLRNVHGCMNCTIKAKRVDWFIITEAFENSGCKLISKKTDYINNGKDIEFICTCGNNYACCWKSFMKGVRCEFCGDLKRINTCMEKYKNSTYLHSEDYKKYMQENFNCINPTHNKMLLDKQLSSSFSKKIYIFPSGREEYIQGFEHITLNHLLSIGIHEDDILCGSNEEIPVIRYFYEEKYHFYFPDIYIKKLNLIIEVKSNFTYKAQGHMIQNHTKWEYTQMAGYDLDVYIYKNKKGILTDLYKYRKNYVETKTDITFFISD